MLTLSLDVQWIVSCENNGKNVTYLEFQKHVSESSGFLGNDCQI